MPEAFDALAVDLARGTRRARVPGYAPWLCASRGVDPERFSAALDEAGRRVPTDAFKMATVFAFPLETAKATFRTSGTTVGARGTHALRDPSTYDAAALAFGRAMLATDLPVPAPMLVLGLSDADAPDSSLARMNARFVRAWGAPGASGTAFHLPGTPEQVAAIAETLESWSPSRPGVVLATSFALVHLLDELGSRRLALPPGSRVMHTGGTKGRSREVARDALREAVATLFGLDPRRVIGEYGMTELLSQFWEGCVARSGASQDVYLEPPWARVVPVHPWETPRRVAAGRRRRDRARRGSRQRR